jgi:hypothetical protein
MRIRTILATAAAPAALAAILLGTAGQASAAALPHLTGSVALAGPADQWASLNNIAAPGSGSLSYTNFNVADSAASGVGSLPKGTAIPLSFNLDGTPYNHTLIVDSIQPTGLASFTFTGHGSWDGDAKDYTWTATGSVTGEALTMHLVYTGTGNPGYTVDASATIDPATGTLTGTASSSAGQSFTLTGSGAFQALSFNAPVDHVTVTPSSAGGGDAQFSSAIPAGHTYEGVGFTETVHDGGSPGAGHDSWSQNPSGPSVITAGNLTVH